MKKHIVEYKEKEDDYFITRIIYDSAYMQQAIDKSNELKGLGYEVYVYTDKSYNDN